MKNIEKDMTPILLKDLGMRYPTEKSKRKYRYGLYQCQYCGKGFEATTNNINRKQGGTKSCGCFPLNIDKITHHKSTHRLYGTWIKMKARCCDKNNPSYLHYGARGIQVCDRWMDINNFIEDMYPSWEEGLTLDRIDVNGNYEPDNCRWVEDTIQASNTRNYRKNNTSGFRGVKIDKNFKFICTITVNRVSIYLGYFDNPLEAGKAYERYVRLNNLEHNFTPALTEEEIEELNKGISNEII